MANDFIPPTACSKCEGLMEEGFAVDNSKIIHADHPAHGNRVKLGGSASWWKIAPPEGGSQPVAPGPGGSFKADKVIASEVGLQIFTFRCQNCGYLESFAPE